MNARRDGEPLDIDRVAEEIRQDQLDDATVTASADRVWRRLAEGWDVDPGEAGHRPLRTRQDYEALVDEYVQGRLSPGRRALVEEYARENPDFRKRLERARRGDVAAPAAPGARPTPTAPRSRRAPRWWLAGSAVAAAVLVAVALVAFYGGAGSGELPRFVGADGPAYLLTDGGPRLLDAGDAIPEDGVVRTSRNGGAFVELPDGSVVELGERTELGVDEARRGTTVDLDRGRVIVEAAEQRTGRLFVATDDSVVSVTGTVFSVNSGRKGSRVSVLEGEVRVDHGGRTDILRPGQQLATDPRLQPVALEEEVAWSRNAERHLAMLSELIDVGREVQDELERTRPRHASPLLELVPEDAVVYAAVPNLSGNVERAYTTFLDGVSSSPVLSEWWHDSVASEGTDARIEEVVDEVARLGSYLGEELVVTLSAPTGGDEPPSGLVMARATDAAGLRRHVGERLATLREESGGGELPLRLIDDPTALSDGSDALAVWVADDLVAASWEPGALRDLARRRAGGGAAGPGGAFRERIEHAYEEGVEWLMALDVATLTEEIRNAAAEQGRDPARASATLRLLGLETAETVITERKSTAVGTSHRASIDFSGRRTGLASLLAAPAPIGAMEMLSPETSTAVAAALREPTDVAREMIALLDELFPGFSEELDRLEREQGVRIVEDLARPLGGDMAFALDGPMLPVPAWKLAIEVYDPERLQRTIETIVGRIDAALAARLDGGIRVTVQPTTVRSRPAWTIGPEAGSPVVAYTFIDGYLLAVPGRGHLERALRYHDAGARFVDTERFDELLPEDGHVHVSALVFQDLGERLGGLIQAAGSSVDLSEREQHLIGLLEDKLSASLLVAYAKEDRITLSTTTPSDKVGMDVAGTLGLLGNVRRGGLADLLRGSAGRGSLEVR